jgi:prevent-host-death family protein
VEVNVHHAKTHLSKLIQQAENGEEVIIARNGKPAVRLVPVAQNARKRSILGSGIGKIWISPDFDSPEMNREIEELFYKDDPKFDEK